MMIENKVASIVILFIGLICGVGLIVAGWYEEKNHSMGVETSYRGNALLNKIVGYAISGFCFIGLVRTLILLLF